MIKNRLSHWFGLFVSRRARKGVVAVEMALTMAFIWLPLLLGVTDGTIYLLVNEKLDRIAYTINDIITQYPSTPSCNTLEDIMLSAGQLMQPMRFNPTPNEEGNYASVTGYIIVTSVYYPAEDSGNIIKWQYKYPSGVTSTVPVSHVGSVIGGEAILPAGVTLNLKDNLIVTEIFYEYSPLFVDAFLAKQLYREVFYKPRLKELLEACE